MNGVVTRYFPSKGYAFIRDADGKTRFFHAAVVEPPDDWDRLREGQSVEFRPAEGRRPGELRAEGVRICSN